MIDGGPESMKKKFRISYLLQQGWEDLRHSNRHLTFVTLILTVREKNNGQNHSGSINIVNHILVMKTSLLVGFFLL